MAYWLGTLLYFQNSGSGSIKHFMCQ